MLNRIYIEISNICNVQCSFCPVVERDKEIMSLESFEKILKQASPLANEICLHLMGEPLAHPKILAILDICTKHNAKIQLTTNGLLLNRYQNQLLTSSCIRQINFSLQAFKDNFPHKDLNSYLLPILDFARKAEQVSPELYLNLRLWNEGDINADNTDIFDLIDRYFEIKINRTVDVGGIKSKRIWNRLYLHFDSRFEWPSLESPRQGTQGRCNGVLKHIGVQANGIVVPCCLDTEAVIELGNCLSEDLSSILKNKRTQSMREGFLNGRLVEDLCQRCTYINRFQK